MGVETRSVEIFSRALSRTGIKYVLFCGILLFVGHASAAENAPAANTNQVAASTNATALPLLQVPAQLEAASAMLDSVDATVTEDSSISSIQSELPVTVSEIQSRLQEDSKVLSSAPSLENLRRLSREWQDPLQELSSWKHALTKRATQLDADLAHISELQTKWDLTRASIEQDTKAPPELLNRIRQLIERIAKTRARLETEQAEMLKLQSTIAEENAKIAPVQSALDRARSDVVAHLFKRDSPPIWSSQLWSQSTDTVLREGQSSITRQVRAIGPYLARRTARLALQLACIAVLTFAFSWLAKVLRAGPQGDPALARAAHVFEIPLATAIVVSLLASRWIYPHTPRLFAAMMGAALLIPAAMVLRRVVHRELFPILNILIFFYFLDQVRMVAASQAFLSRVLLATESLIGAAFAWVTWRRSIKTESEDRLRRAVRVGARLLCVCFTVAFVANLVGRVSLGKFISHAILASAYLALLLYALVNIAEGLIVSILASQPLVRFKLVQRHRILFQERACRVLQFGALVLWLLFLLEAIALRGPLFRYAHELLTKSITIRALHFSIGDLLLFLGTIWLSFLLSRFIQFLLEEEVYPRVQLAPGLHYSISKMLHYIVLVIGFLLAVALLGFNLSKFTILVSAFGVGLGFGLQNIINNFVSGIILLFERPIKVGDVIQFDVNQGIVRRIGIRASIIKTTSGSEIIIPNGKLISDPVTNWTLSNRQQLIEITFAVAPGPDPRKVIDLLKSIVTTQPQIMKSPPPQVLFLNMNGGLLNFQIRTWTDQVEDWLRVRSDLFLAITSKLSSENITIK
jgi:potassium efflux system protein